MTAYKKPSDQELAMLARKALSFKCLLRAERDGNVDTHENALSGLPLFSLNVICICAELGWTLDSGRIQYVLSNMQRIMEIQNCKAIIPSYKRVEYTTSQAKRIFELAGFNKEVPKANVYIKSINPVGYYMHFLEMDVNTIYRIFPWHCLPGHTAVHTPKHR